MTQRFVDRNVQLAIGFALLFITSQNVILAKAFPPRPTEITTMRAYVVPQLGPPEVMRVGEVPKPTPGDHDLLVEVHATSVNPVDAKIRVGTRPRAVPLVLGFDASGVVVGMGAQVKGFNIGDEAIFVFLFDQAFDCVGRGAHRKLFLPGAIRAIAVDGNVKMGGLKTFG